MDAPEVRLSPDRAAIAYRFQDGRWTIQRGEFFERYVADADIADWAALLPVSSEDEPVDVYLPGGRYYGRWITVTDHDVTLGCSCGYFSSPEDLPPVLDRAADELHRGH